MHQKNKLISFVVGGIPVRQKDTLYSLNDLHKASGDEAKNKPSEWLRLVKTKELIVEIEKAEIPAITSIQRKGTYGTKQVVYAYAMWISPKFHLHVIDAYDALVNERIDEAKDLASRTILKDDYLPMGAALQQHRLEQGKATKGYHYSNEADMINKIMTGLKSKQLKATYDVESVRDNLTHYGKKSMISLQRANTALIEMGFDYHQRKARLTQLLKDKWNNKPLIDHQSLLPNQVAA